VPEPPMEEFVILKEKIKLPEIAEEEMPKE
jgi:hypothetical protein